MGLAPLCSSNVCRHVRPPSGRQNHFWQVHIGREVVINHEHLVQSSPATAKIISRGSLTSRSRCSCPAQSPSFALEIRHFITFTTAGLPLGSEQKHRGRGVAQQVLKREADTTPVWLHSSRQQTVLDSSLRACGPAKLRSSSTCSRCQLR